jgi:uncharacterized membrane protein
VNAGNRAARLDALRGAAIVWMLGFHLCYDLNEFGWLNPLQHFTRDPFWTLQRSCIVSLFMLCAGAGQGLAMAAGLGWARFWRRWGQVAGCALLVSAGSALMFPHSWIRFGVLHGAAVMLLLLRWSWPWLLRWPGQGAALPGYLLLLGGLAWWLPSAVAHPLFNSAWLNWSGLVTRLPVTVDYVPVFPWLAMVLWGAALAWWAQASASALLLGPLPSGLKPLAWLGRHTLSIYMLHQPVFMGLVWAVSRWQQPG